MDKLKLTSFWIYQGDTGNSPLMIVSGAIWRRITRWPSFQWPDIRRCQASSCGHVSYLARNACKDNIIIGYNRTSGNFGRVFCVCCLYNLCQSLWHHIQHDTYIQRPHPGCHEWTIKNRIQVLCLFYINYLYYVTDYGGGLWFKNAFQFILRCQK